MIDLLLSCLQLMERDKELQQLSEQFGFQALLHSILMGLIGRVADIKGHKHADAITELMVRMT